MGGNEAECRQPITRTTFDFEGGNIDGWIKQNPGAGITITQEDKHGGLYALKMVNGSATSAWSVQAFTPDIDINPGDNYRVSFWIRAVDGGGRGRISAAGSGGQIGATYWADFNVGNDWQQLVYTNLPATGTKAKLSFDLGYIANKTYYIDDIVIEDLDAKTAIPQKCIMC
jgi:endo-1,4-beta-xylanase